MIKVFKDDTTNKAFHRDGYYKVDQLLSKTAVKKLTAFYSAHPMHHEKPFVSTNYSTDKTYRRSVFSALDTEIYPPIDELLHDYIGLTGAFFVKKARKPSKVGLHIDWQMVEEPEHVGLNVWIPLVNTHRFNGCIKVVPGSHKENIMLRGPNYIVPQSLISKPIHKKHYKALYLKAGDALIFDNRLMHLSEKNRWFKDRLAISYLMAPKSAQPVHYYFHTEGNEVKSIRKYKVDQHFYVEDIAFQNTNGHYALSESLGESYDDVTGDYESRLKSSLQFIASQFT